MRMTPVRRCARPITIHHKKAGVVLCLHGLTGYPGEMAYPAMRLHQAGWDVRVPRLSGHGSSGEDLRHCTVKDWVRQVRDEWMNLKAVYQEVFLLGHSMGALLAINLALEHPVEKLALLAPAIGIRVSDWFSLNILSLFIPRLPQDWKPNPEYRFFDDRDEDDDAYLGQEYWSWRWLGLTKQILRLQRSCEKKLQHLRTPILGVFAEKDKLSTTVGARILQENLQSPYKQITLPGARHYIPYDPYPGSKESAMDAVISWFKNKTEKIA